ncbi:LysR substrate-binding domain-containing protein [Rhodobacteraceae bacterium D3-12]|nr:LysR substrate-binding domain-containing protein [Rhodobacteraceae bacterium D3-12]
MPLPPLNALRAFEAAARHNGYIAAADELCVTRGAISRHVKLLEEHLGVALFRRHAKGVDLTTAGQRLLPVLTDAFARIERETSRLSAGADDLRMICPPALSIRWLFPRLQAFRERHPDINLRVTTDFYGETGFDAAEYDLGLSLEHIPGRPAHITARPLFPMLLSPACAPGLLPLDSPADLARTTLLHDRPRSTDWAIWLDHFGINGVDAAQGESFPNLDMAARAARFGTGVLMVDLALCREELDSGALHLPFPDMACATDFGRYSLIAAQDSWRNPKVRAFADWAEEVAAKDAETRPLIPTTASPQSPTS